MNAKDRRKQHRHRHLVELGRDSVSTIASLQLRLHKVQESFDKKREEVAELREVLALAVEEREVFRKLLKEEHAASQQRRADAERWRARAEAWEKSAREHEAAAKEARKLRQRLDAKAQAERLAPAHRKAATLCGGDER